MVTTGEIVESGTYKCTSCGYAVKIGEDSALPTCPECDNESFEVEVTLV